MRKEFAIKHVSKQPIESRHLILGEKFIVEEREPDSLRSRFVEKDFLGTNSDETRRAFEQWFLERYGFTFTHWFNFVWGRKVV